MSEELNENELENVSGGSGMNHDSQVEKDDYAASMGEHHTHPDENSGSQGPDQGDYGNDHSPAGPENHNI